MTLKMRPCVRLLKFFPVAATIGCASILGGAATGEAPPVNLELAAVPETTGLPASLDEIQAAENQHAWDRFAWQTFIALNWPAVEPAAANGYLRGFPDLSKPASVNFVNAGKHDGPLVWETFIEKREMFVHDAKTREAARPQPWNSPFFAKNSDVSAGQKKRIFGNGKFATLDETVEVRAEALENYPDKFLIGMPVAARVFRGTTASPDTAVRYEVKMNYDFYKYVVDNGLYFDPTAAARSTKLPPVQLPWRTSLPEPGVSFLTQKPAETPYVQGYSLAETLVSYKDGAMQASAKNDVLPPRLGAIHVKSAWAPIEESEKPKFLWREAEYFSGVSKKVEKGLFGLVGFHIIQRIKIQAPQNALNNNAIGGTFIYSTWEHTDIREKPEDRDGTQYTYTNYFANPAKPTELAPQPGLDDPLYVYRLYPILSHTREFNQKVWQEVGKESVWSHYRLVGTQFLPVDIENDGPIANAYPGPHTVPIPNKLTNPNDPTFIGQPAYLSNLVIETNLGLQQFQGQPPGVTPVQQFSSSVTNNPTSTFFRTSRDVAKSPVKQDASEFGNLRFGNSRTAASGTSNAYNMGGCMGCHGVAHLNGFSFSFVLLGGQAGADPDSEKAFDVPFTAIAAKNILLLVSGDSTPLQSSAGTYLAGSGSTAVVQAEKAYLTIAAADGRPAGSSLRFGDGVTIQDGSGQYLTAGPAASAKGPSPVSFAAAMTPASVWYLYDSQNPNSSGDVLRLNKLSFRSAAVTYPPAGPPGLPLPALLSNYFPGTPGGVSTVNHASTDELWTALK